LSAPAAPNPAHRESDYQQNDQAAAAPTAVSLVPLPSLSVVPLAAESFVFVPKVVFFPPHGREG
jgi:hypothetical protein